LSRAQGSMHVAMCLQVGMQSSALAAVLAKLHFPDQPMVGGVVRQGIKRSSLHGVQHIWRSLDGARGSHMATCVGKVLVVFALA